MTIKAVAEEIGVSRPYLSLVERGKNDPLSPERIAQVAEFLGLTEDEHLGLRALEALSRGRITFSGADMSDEHRVAKTKQMLREVDSAMAGERTLPDGWGFIREMVEENQEAIRQAWQDQSPDEPYEQWFARRLVNSFLPPAHKIPEPEK